MQQKASTLFWRSFWLTLLPALAALGLFWGCCTAWEGIQAVAAREAPAVARLADGRLRILDQYLPFF